MSRAAQVVVRVASPKDSNRTLRRFCPAGFASLAFHVVLVGLFVLLSPVGQAIIPSDPIDNSTVIGTEQPYEPGKDDPLVATIRNDDSLERDRDPNYKNPIKGDFSLPGAANPLDNPGIKGGELDAILRDLGPAKGHTMSPEAPGGKPGDDGNIFTKLLQPGGVFSGGFNPDYFKTARGSATTRQQLLEEGGGTNASEAAVGRGLRWLARQQFPDGSWRLDGNFPDKGANNDIAGTAFGLLPFLGAGKTQKPAKDNPFDKPVEKGLLFLMRKQDKRSGNFGGGMYGHGLASIAICEAYGLTQDPALRRSAQLAINYIVAAQHDGGGWRYAPGQAGDLSVSGWQIMALKSAQLAGLDVPPLAMKKAQRFLDACVNPNDEGYGYVGVGTTPTMTAVGLLCRQYLQSWGPQNIRLIKSIDLNLKPNEPGRKRDIYYYYYATQVLRHFGGEAWKQWNAKMRDTLVKSQDDNPKSPQYGSWSAAGDVHGSSGGRLMVTSLNLLTLEVYYRHLPLYYRETGARSDTAVKKAL